MVFIQTTSAFGIFLMWLKVFYWCRLFSSLSYYVKLIQQVIIDSAPFMVMVGIIHFAFGSFLWVFNTELEWEMMKNAQSEPKKGPAADKPGADDFVIAEYFNN